MAGTSRFISLLATPFPTLVTHLRRPLFLYFPHLTCAFRRLSTLYTHTHLSPISPIKASQQFHAQPINNGIPLNPTHPWPEWSSFITFLAGNAQLSPAVEDSFVAYEDFSHDFLTAATQCLAFARHRPDLIRSLSRKDIEVVVSNGTPFLFKAALETARRMRAFLAIDGSSVPDHDNANTVDLMKYILSYASKPTVSSGISSFYSRQLIESSCRNLLHELAEVSRGTPAVDLPLTEQRPTRQNIVMKRGDWVCQKCEFMNFARNNKCLECEEPRPRRQLTGGEWECPRCDYLNYGRNLVCLRCDCGRPAAASLRTTHFAYPNGNDPRLAESDEKAQRWFSKMNNASDMDSDSEDFPEIIPLRKGENKFVVSTRKTPLERRLANSQFKRNNSIPEQTDESDKGKSSDYVPFVPIPRDMFDKKNETSIMDLKENPETSHQTISASVGNDLQSKERGEADKSDTWFKKIAELHDVKDLPSAISDDDFPEIMPVRKGENRFVVSKKKDRSLTSPMYKRQVAMEQGNNSNFVPFVPFPPGYFEKKDAQQPDSSSESISSNSGSPTTYSKTADVDNSAAQTPDDQFTSSNISRDDGVPTSCRNSDDKDVRSEWSGKSLEGSAVKEVDPLDMSEEAKAERWFRRVAQIKDVSELSQIPDEDFPSIMPMRKGVNRFVVSKRKTPLERRLTSTQYRRNLPVVTSDSLKTESYNGENEAT